MKTNRQTRQLAAAPSGESGSASDTFHARLPGANLHQQPGASTSTSADRLNLRSKSVHWEPKFPLDLVFAYEDETTRSRALVLYDHLAHTLQDDHDIQHSWWKLDLLLNPQVLDRGIDAAVDADVIIVALRSAKEPPRIARTWVEGWRDRKDGHHSALVALVDNAPSARYEDCPVLSYLNSIAHQAQMAYFSHVFPAAPLNVGSPFVDISARATTITPLLEEIFRRTTNVPLWGINEY